MKNNVLRVFAGLLLVALSACNSLPFNQPPPTVVVDIQSTVDARLTEASLNLALTYTAQPSETASLTATAAATVTPIPSATESPTATETLTLASTDSAQPIHTADPAATALPVATDTPSADATASLPTYTPTSGTGILSGLIQQPGNSLHAPLLIFAYAPDIGYYRYLEVLPGTNHYSIEVPAPADYIVYAHSIDRNQPDLGVAYTNAVFCGLTAECTDHAVRRVTVAIGKTVSKVNLLDWLQTADLPAPLFDLPMREFPLFATATPTLDFSQLPTALPSPLTPLPTVIAPGTIAPNVTQSAEQGVVVGSIGTNSATNIVVFAKATKGGRYGYYVTVLGESTFQLDLFPGTYQIFAYRLSDLSAGNAAPSGGGYTAGGSTLATVTVVAGEKINDVVIDNWNMPAGSLPTAPIIPEAPPARTTP